jgi:hypothetical protein
MAPLRPARAQRLAELRAALHQRAATLDRLKSDPDSDAYRLMREEAEGIAAEIRRLKRNGGASGRPGRLLGWAVAAIGLCVAAYTQALLSELAGVAAVILGFLLATQ